MSTSANARYATKPNFTTECRFNADNRAAIRMGVVGPCGRRFPGSSGYCDSHDPNAGYYEQEDEPMDVDTESESEDELVVVPPPKAQPKEVAKVNKVEVKPVPKVVAQAQAPAPKVPLLSSRIITKPLPKRK
ncbi:uncharacterized protein LOC62_03G003971 [Vanrija pseudolonga]|uniref:Uncharacterized protein n=1 Tax=Vanrija pseudolonga TaxID=143232 RepID=A0AAF0Y5P3_9TREE|nr:hypothetical protein LOC62_03G003971 [Vanrija pseudolonga]